MLPWFGLDHSSVVAAFEPVFAGRPGWRRIYVDLPDHAGHLATALGRRSATRARRL